MVQDKPVPYAKWQNREQPRHLRVQRATRSMFGSRRNQRQKVYAHSTRNLLTIAVLEAPSICTIPPRMFNFQQKHRCLGLTFGKR